MKPYLFQLPDWLPIAAGRPLFSYGVMLGISFILGWGLSVFLSRRDGMDAKVASTTIVMVVLVSLFGARAMHFIADTNARFSIANFFKFDEGGLVAYGGIIGGLFGSWAFLRVKGGDWWAWIDNAAPGLSLGLGVTRVGCLLFGCDYGMKSEVPWAIRFPRWEDPDVVAWIKRSAPAYVDHLAGAVDSARHFSDYVHPTQLYESFVGFAGFALCMLWRPLKRFHGQIMMVFLIYYGVCRFLLELIRGDADRNDDVGGLGLSTSQLTAVAMLVACGILWRLRATRGLYPAPGTAAWGTPPSPRRA